VSDRPKAEHASPVVPHSPLTQYYPDAHKRRPFVDWIFDTNAKHYEWINKVMSLGMGIRYRREALERAGVGEGMRVLDVCTGSGQVARAGIEMVGPSGRVACLDASLGMLYEASRIIDAPLIQGYVERLPIAGGSFDAVTMGYALRHVAELNATFREYHRVLRPGGRLLVLELTRPQSRFMYHGARFYLKRVVPAVSRLKGREARTLMEYFWDTIEDCVSPETILDAMATAGFEAPRRFGQIELFSEYTATRP
jgi:demethylmenaquinone methyltransferase/2-methoxy-6-polyprenyl-1,4-benzoquinol methylase